jgi:RNA polymerase sigma-70 factor (sigma-E family)
VEGPARAADAAERGRLAELYLRYAPGGIRLAYLLTGDKALAQDLVQEAFARFVGRLGHLREPAAFEAYLRRALVNLSKNHHRRRRVERSFLDREARFPLAASEQPDPSSRDMIRAALLALPERQRTAIVLRFYLDLSETQIADLLRCRPGTVRSLVSRGLQALRRLPEVTR